MGGDLLMFEGGPLDGIAVPGAGDWPPPTYLDPTALAIRHRVDIRVAGRYRRESFADIPPPDRANVSRAARYEWEPTP